MHEDMLNQTAASLRLLAREVWKRDQVALTIVERLGDMPHIPVNAYEIVADPNTGTFDIWKCNGEGIAQSDLTMGAVLDLLPRGQGNG